MRGPATVPTPLILRAAVALHSIRDNCYREDNSTNPYLLRPRVMASLRNLAIGALRLAGRARITESTRWACRNARCC